MNDRPIHVVGGGLAGLVAAITAAETGAPVVLHEAANRLGGRALAPGHRRAVNLGPHVALTDGALLRWLRQRQIHVPVRGPAIGGVRILDDDGLRLPIRESVRLAPTAPPRPAPIDASFAAWATSTFGDERGRLMSRLAGLFTFHHDPGALSAHFVWERWRRVFLGAHRVRWIAGGWSTLIAALAARAEALGVTVVLDDRLTAADLPDAPTVVATQLASAGRLLGRPLEWSGTRTALVDIVLERDRWPAVVADVRSDLVTCCMVERETAFDPDLLGDRHADLFQAHLGIPDGVGAAGGAARIDDTLDLAIPGWRRELWWREARLVVNATGAVDLPGTTWRDRPAVNQGDSLFLAGDAVAAPGLLSEVSVNSAVQAARLALDARRRRAFAAGWPSVELTPGRRLAILAAALPGAGHHAADAPDGDAWTLEPVDETGPGYRLVAWRGFVFGAAADVGEAPATSMVAAPSWLPRRQTVSRLLAALVLRRHAGRHWIRHHRRHRIRGIRRRQRHQTG